MKGWIIGIDASRNRSGGAKTYIIEFLMVYNHFEHGISNIKQKKNIIRRI